MTKNEFKVAANIAMNETNLKEDISVFSGCALPGFQPVFCTIRQVAALIRWQCAYLSGGFDMEELNDIAYLAKTRFLIIDELKEAVKQERIFN